MYCDPDEDDEVRLRFADGKESGWIKADSLTQAAPSDAGYEALLQSWVVWCKAGAIARTAGGKLGVVTDDPDSDHHVELGRKELQ